jgi:hypothetical protein
MNQFVLIALLGIFNNPDSVIRGIYINPYQASKKEYLQNVFARADSGLINTIVVDFKSDYGFLAYQSEIELAKKISAIKPYIDANYLIKESKKHNLKLVARIVVFKDNYLARYKHYGITDDSAKVWHDAQKIAWVNPYQREVGGYIVEVAKEIVNLGINALAFDYIRFPTDGDVKRIRLLNVNGPRDQAIINLLKRIRKEVDAEIGICVFGYAVWHSLKSEGQNIRKMGKYIDVLYPMLYPSHFHPSFKNELNEYWRNYWLYFDSVKEAFKKLPEGVKVIPFIQGFDLRTEEFNNDYISSQIDGSIDARGDGFIIWNARADYSCSWPALSWAHNSIPVQYAQMNPGIHRREEGYRYQGIDFLLQTGQLKIQGISRSTSPGSKTRIDTRPLLQIRKFFPDPLLP